MQKPRIMQGVMELLPKDQIAFQSLLDRIRQGFERFGYLPIETPVMELTEILLTKSGGETEKQVYFAQSTGAREQGKDPDLALRFDLTVPLARYVAQREGQLTFPLRRYQMQRVYRGERPQRGRYREFFQCDIDVVGKDQLDLRFDAEVPAVMIGIFQELEVGDFTVHLSNRKLLLGLLCELGIAADLQPGVLREIDKLDKRGEEALSETLGAEPFALSQEVRDRLLGFIAMNDSASSILEQLAALNIQDVHFAEGLQDLQRVIACMQALQTPEDCYRINLAIARGLDYYTGMVFETFLDAHPELGSICSGGRYDNLAEHYTKSRLPGVGMSIGATRLFYKLQELGLIEAGEPTAKVLVTQQDSQYFTDYLAMASELRQAGIATETILEEWKFKKQMKYANSCGVRYVLIAGKSELAAGEVQIKDMISGEQSSFKRSTLPQDILHLLKRDLS